nr:Gag-Pol polyprotein [Tanacetum cinerariifolium]
MVADLRYFNFLESEVDSLISQLETQKTQFVNEIDRLSREYYYADHMNVILGVYTELDEVTNLQCDYLELLQKCECLETELSKSKKMSKSFESVQTHAINLELELQQLFQNSGLESSVARQKHCHKDGENLDKMKEKGDECIFVGYSTQSRAYRVFNKRTRVIMESIHVNFDELPQMVSAHNSSDPAPACQTMASDQHSFDPAPECQTMALEHNSLSPGRKCQENASHGDKTRLNEEMVADLRYFNSLEYEVDSLTSQLETQKTQFVNEIDRLSREYFYADHMNAILGVYTKLDEVTNLQCGYLELLQKCECLETELSKSKKMSKSFESVQKHAINLELELQQCKEKVKNDMSFKVNKSKDFCKEREQYFEIQDLKAQLQDKGIAIIASESIKKPRNNVRKLPERFGKTYKWSYIKFTPSGYIWKPKSKQGNVNPNVSMPLGNASRTANVKDTMTSRRSIVSNTPLKSTCFIRDLKGNDLLTGSRGTDLYSITLQSTSSPNPICLMAKATSSQAWLWHRRLS